ncbi:MAG: hypothetical protein GYA14_04900 [Ignavibacteria bacterium]|nr:hypothetical protein [Ignavibacteria bacterium]
MTVLMISMVLIFFVLSFVIPSSNVIVRQVIGVLGFIFFIYTAFTQDELKYPSLFFALLSIAFILRNFKDLNKLLKTKITK